MESFLQSNWFIYLILPLLIMLARVTDVTIGTLRIILVAKGNKYYAPILGFFEVLIWVITLGAIMQNLTNVAAYLGYASGYALGNYVGILLEERLAMGNVIVHVITKEKAGDLIRILKARRYTITHFKATGNQGDVSVIYILVKRKNLQRLVERVKKTHPKSFFSIEDVRYVSDGLMPLKHSATRRNRSNFIKVSRPGK